MIVNKCFEFLNKYEKLYAKQFDSKNDDYREINQKEKTDFINNKHNMLPVHEQLSKLDLNNTLMDFDASSLYPSAMWDKNSVHPKIETGFAFKPQMKNVYVQEFKNQSFNQDGKESSILKIQYYNPPNLIFQHLPVKKLKK